MALNIKNVEAENLASEVAELAGESMTGAVIQALKERKQRLVRQRERARRMDDAREFLETEVWSLPINRELSDDELLGYGDGGA